MNCNRWAFLLTDRRIGLSLCVAPHLVPCQLKILPSTSTNHVRTLMQSRKSNAIIAECVCCETEETESMLRFLFSGFAASCCCELCAALYAKLWLPQRLLQAAACCCCLLPVSIHLSSVTLGGTEAACEYLSENVALVSTTAAAATSATLPYLSPRQLSHFCYNSFLSACLQNSCNSAALLTCLN